MARFCHICGKEISDGASFCSECGTRIPCTAKSDSNTDTEPNVQSNDDSTEHINKGIEYADVYRKDDLNIAPVYTSDQPKISSSPSVHTSSEPKSTSSDADSHRKYGPLGTGAYFALILLFAIPVIGIISCIIMAVAPKNVNIKHFARAVLIWALIAIILAAASVVTAYIFRDAIADLCRNTTGRDPGELARAVSEFFRITFGISIPLYI